MSEHIGFDNTYGVGMPEPLAERLGIQRISDLVSHLDQDALSIRLSDEFLHRPDGWRGLQDRYKLPAIRERGIDHSLAYRGLASGSHQVTDVFTTDAEILAYNIRVLEDDRNYFPKYHAVVLMRKDIPSQVAESIRRLEHLIDNREMIELNSRVRFDRADDRQVAADYLNHQLNLTIPRANAANSRKASQLLRSMTGHLIEHMLLVTVSLAAAIVVAIPLGIVSYCRPRLGHAVLNSVGVIQTIPAMAVLVMTIPLLGLGAWPAIFALFLYSLLPIVRNTFTGLSTIPSPIRESAEVLGLSRAARLRLIELPLASTSIMAGIKTAAVINVGTATIGALVGAGGFGQPILTGIRLDDFSLILQGAVPAALLAIAVQSLCGWAERFVIPAGLRLSQR